MEKDIPLLMNRAKIIKVATTTSIIIFYDDFFFRGRRDYLWTIVDNLNEPFHILLRSKRLLYIFLNT